MGIGEAIVNGQQDGSFKVVEAPESMETEMQMADALLMERLNRERIIRRAGTARQLARELGLNGKYSVTALDVVLLNHRQDESLNVDLLVAAEDDAAGCNRYGDIALHD